MRSIDHWKRHLSIVLIVLLTGACLQAALGHARAPITLEQIVELSKQGRSDGDIIALIRNSRPDFGMADAGISRIRVGGRDSGLTGSRLARLHDQGVSDAILDEIQAVYLSQVREQARLKYQNWGKGPGGFL